MSLESITLSKARKSLDKIIDITGLDYADISDICGKNVSNTHQFFYLGLENANKFLDHLNIDMPSFINNDYCEDTLIKQSQGLVNTIPEKYIGNMGSKAKTIKNALSFCSEYSKNCFLKKYQISNAFISNDDNRLSVEILGRVFNHAMESTRSRSIVEEIGKSNATNFIGDFNGLISRNTPLDTAYDTLIEQTRHLIETNLKYSILSKSKNSVTIQSKRTEEAVSLTKDIENPEVIFTRNVAGFLAGFSHYKYDTPLDVKITSCGPIESTYEVFFR